MQVAVQVQPDFCAHSSHFKNFKKDTDLLSGACVTLIGTLKIYLKNATCFLNSDKITFVLRRLFSYQIMALEIDMLKVRTVNGL